MGTYKSTKIFDNYSIALRQWKAQHSHCQLLHGYAIKFKVEFKSIEGTPIDPDTQLDETNWVADFALFSRNGLKKWLDDMFDHTTLIEKDDPQLDSFRMMEELGLLKLVVMDRMGAESLAKLVHDKFNSVFEKTEGGRIRVAKVECFENDKNSGIYETI